MDMEPQNELLLQVTDIYINERIVKKEIILEINSTEAILCPALKKVIKKLEIVLDILEK